jgi:hypothetical protein
MTYSFIACGHVASALLSLAAGALVLGWPKGTQRHKLAGPAADKVFQSTGWTPALGPIDLPVISWQRN